MHVSTLPSRQWVELKRGRYCYESFQMYSACRHTPSLHQTGGSKAVLLSLLLLLLFLIMKGTREDMAHVHEDRSETMLVICLFTLRCYINLINHNRMFPSIHNFKLNVILLIRMLNQICHWQPPVVMIFFFYHKDKVNAPHHLCQPRLLSANVYTSYSLLQPAAIC